VQRSRAIHNCEEKAKRKRDCLEGVTFYYSSRLISFSRCDFRLDENSSGWSHRLGNWTPFGVVDEEQGKENTRVATSDCATWALNDDARRYRGNFVADNSHGDIIGPGPINGKGSSCLSSPRISSRRTLDPYRTTPIHWSSTLSPLFRTHLVGKLDCVSAVIR